jgi:hypothetical protein
LFNIIQEYHRCGQVYTLKNIRHGIVFFSHNKIASVGLSAAETMTEQLHGGESRHHAASGCEEYLQNLDSRSPKHPEEAG